MDPKWPPQLPLIDLSLFQGSLIHLGASRGLRSQKYRKARPILGRILTFLDPPANPVNFYWPKMVCADVPHIILHVLCSTRTPKSDFSGLKMPLRGAS